MKPSRSHFFACCVLSLTAVFAFAPRAEAGAAEDIERAESSLRAGDVVTAFSLLRKAADQNHPGAQARLADLLRAAEFYQEALALYRKAAEQGDAAGEFGLGRMYADGLGVPRDPAVALDWYRKAEKKNHAPALDALARAYRTGDLGLARDLERAGALDARVRGLQQAAAKDTK